MSESQSQSLFAVGRVAVEQQRRMLTEAVEAGTAMGRAIENGIEMQDAAAEATIELGRLATRTPLVVADAGAGDEVADTRAAVDEGFDDLQAAREDAFAEAGEYLTVMMDAIDDVSADGLALYDRQTDLLFEASDDVDELLRLTTDGVLESSDLFADQLVEFADTLQSQVRLAQDGLFDGMDAGRRQFERGLETAGRSVQVPVDGAVTPPAETDGAVEAESVDPPAAEGGVAESAAPEEEEAMD